MDVPAWIRDRPIAHRGLHDEHGCPENSIAAFERGLAAGYPLELDVHMLTDGTLAVFHDDDLHRMTGVGGQITARDWAYVRKLKLGGTDESIPLLRDVLELVDGRAPLLIEIKNRFKVGVLEHALYRELQSYSGEIAVQSFNPFSIAWFRRNAPHIARGQLSTDFWGTQLAGYKKMVLRHMALHPWAKPSFIGYDLRCLPYWAPTLFRRRGLALLAWTVRSQEDVTRAESVADNYIFERVRPDPKREGV